MEGGQGGLVGALPGGPGLAGLLALGDQPGVAGRVLCGAVGAVGLATMLRFPARRAQVIVQGVGRRAGDEPVQ